MIEAAKMMISTESNNHWDRWSNDSTRMRRISNRRPAWKPIIRTMEIDSHQDESTGHSGEYQPIQATVGDVRWDMGVSMKIWKVTPMAGGFMLGRIPPRNGWWLGVPLFQETPHIIYIYITHQNTETHLTIWSPDALVFICFHIETMNWDKFIASSSQTA